MVLSNLASNAIVFVTYGLMLVMGVGLALWKKSDKHSFLNSNGTQKALPLSLNFIASG